MVNGVEQEPKKENKVRDRSGGPIVWFLISLMAVSIVALMIIYRNTWTSKIGIPQEKESSSLIRQESVSTDQIMESESTTLHETNTVLSQNELEDETQDSLREQYAQLEEPVTYSIIQYNQETIEDLHVERAFDVLMDRLKAEGDFYSTVDYRITVFPTLDPNISNLALDEHYADGTIHKGHYRFDYRAKEVTKY
ncbi:hypothetical protein [Facklamia lactis]|uniref:hypothetical protein n=1 Tax=Facklamia lactis TaxID=2749967 RepID=UPI0018CCFB72|nr:hypothetical protein [Facklamia lactis]MBG9979961.1 hypothetical protein [Facklamia lactis]